MSEFSPLREAVDSLAGRAPSPDFGELKRRAARRGRRRLAVVAAAIVAVVAGWALGVNGSGGDRMTAPAEQPKPVLGSGPVWYDAQGLHHGDVVEQTPVPLLQPEQPVEGGVGVIPARGALALVRSGAVYLDPASGDVWFHPWGGKPRIVGHNSAAGPGGNPNGDTAVWFEGSDAVNAGLGDLVVYDTATGREVSRVLEEHGVGLSSGDHYPAGNRFLQVSAISVTWAAEAQTFTHDLRTHITSAIRSPFLDVHDEIVALGDERGIVVRVPGQADQRYPDLEPHFRLSPSGVYLLGVEGTGTRHAAAIVETGAGELWQVPKNAYPWIAWSYGDVAMVDTEDALLACDAARQECATLHAEHPVLMPTS